jgi:hypothetical protein
VLLYQSPFATVDYTVTPTDTASLRSLGAYLVVLAAFASNATPTKNTLRCVGAALLINGGIQAVLRGANEWHTMSYCVFAQ